MASIKEIQTRMKSIQDTMKITNAMYLISSSKMKKAKKVPCGYGALLLRRAARAGPYAAPSSRYGKGKPVSGSAP